MAYAEVIGDPIAQSKSPLLHRHWLGKLGMAGDYRPLRIAPDELGSYFTPRRADPDWRGCNVTLPHKQAIIPFLDDLTPEAERVGAVNCVVPKDGSLTGFNTDVDGIDAALRGHSIQGERVVVIGAGGAARAMCAFLAVRSPARVTLVARDAGKAAPLIRAGNALMEARTFEDAPGRLAGARLIVNASPLGMRGSPPMPEGLLKAIEDNAAGATLFDMVYDPLTTEFLRRGAAAGGKPVDGLAMLIGQARRAFTLFFGAEAPSDDAELRQILEAKSR